MLTKEQINTLKATLLEMKKEYEQRLEPEENETGNSLRPEETGELSNYDNHPADQGTELFEREKDVALNNHAKQQLDDVKQALRAIENGEYTGKCEVCGDAIPFERLELVPTTRRCVNHAEAKQSVTDRRPVEEGVTNLSSSAKNGEDAWESVSDYGTSQTPSDFPDKEYNSLHDDLDEVNGIDESVEDVPTADIEGNDTGITADGKEHEGGSITSSELDEDTKNE